MFYSKSLFNVIDKKNECQHCTFSVICKIIKRKLHQHPFANGISDKHFISTSQILEEGNENVNPGEKVSVTMFIVIYVDPGLGMIQL